ncbi:MAG: oxygenase MpaB family protein, partial [Mycobacterium sp.]
GTDLPATRPETLDCLRSYLPRLALTHGAAMATGQALADNPDVPQAAKFFDWAIRDAMPDWAAEMVMYTPPHPVERAARRAATWAAINGTQAAMRPLPEFRQAQRRVADGTVCDHTEPTHVPGTDPVRSRDWVERAVGRTL